jgi:hypothetical protein
MEPADSSVTDIRPPAMLVPEIVVNALQGSLELEDIRLAENDNATPGRKGNAQAAFRPALIACDCFQILGNVDGIAQSGVAVRTLDHSGLRSERRRKDADEPNHGKSRPHGSSTQPREYRVARC